LKKPRTTVINDCFEHDDFVGETPAVRREFRNASIKAKNRLTAMLCFVHVFTFITVIVSFSGSLSAARRDYYEQTRKDLAGLVDASVFIGSPRSSDEPALTLTPLQQRTRL